MADESKRFDVFIVSGGEDAATATALHRGLEERGYRCRHYGADDSQSDLTVTELDERDTIASKCLVLLVSGRCIDAAKNKKKPRIQQELEIAGEQDPPIPILVLVCDGLAPAKFKDVRPKSWAMLAGKKVTAVSTPILERELDALVGSLANLDPPVLGPTPQPANAPSFPRIRRTAKNPAVHIITLVVLCIAFVRLWPFRFGDSPEFSPVGFVAKYLDGVLNLLVCSAAALFSHAFARALKLSAKANPLDEPRQSGRDAVFFAFSMWKLSWVGWLALYLLKVVRDLSDFSDKFRGIKNAINDDSFDLLMVLFSDMNSMCLLIAAWTLMRGHVVTVRFQRRARCFILGIALGDLILWHAGSWIQTGAPRTFYLQHLSMVIAMTAPFLFGRAVRHVYATNTLWILALAYAALQPAAYGLVFLPNGEQVYASFASSGNTTASLNATRDSREFDALAASSQASVAPAPGSGQPNDHSNVVHSDIGLAVQTIVVHTHSPVSIEDFPPKIRRWVREGRAVNEYVITRTMERRSIKGNVVSIRAEPLSRDQIDELMLRFREALGWRESLLLELRLKIKSVIFGLLALLKLALGAAVIAYFCKPPLHTAPLIWTSGPPDQFDVDDNSPILARPWRLLKGLGCQLIEPLVDLRRRWRMTPAEKWAERRQQAAARKRDTEQFISHITDSIRKSLNEDPTPYVQDWKFYHYGQFIVMAILVWILGEFVGWQVVILATSVVALTLGVLLALCRGGRTWSDIGRTD